MERQCKTCRKKFEGESWMFQCYECYKKFKGKPRIWTQGKETGYNGVIIFSHPDCTKEEMNEWIAKHYGSVNTPSNWGAVELTGRNAKVWWNCQNDD